MTAGQSQTFVYGLYHFFKSYSINLFTSYVYKNAKLMNVLRMKYLATKKQTCFEREAEVELIEGRLCWA